MATKGTPFTELGVSGLTHSGGTIEEEWLRKLVGERGRRIYREMADNDSTVGAILFAIEMLLRNVEWRVEPFDDTPDRAEDAEFVESLMDDMSHTWEDFIAEVLAMLAFGFAPHEIVYKRRVGPREADPTKRSRHTDGRIGWRKLPIRSPESLDRWEFDEEDGGIKGMWQLPPNGGQTVFLPIEKLLIFRTTSRKSNPEGRSILRNAYVTWYHKAKIEQYEAIGVERDLAGLPIFYIPAEMLSDTASAADRARVAEYHKIIERLRIDDQSGLVLPSVYDADGNQLVKFELAGTGSRRQFDTSSIVGRKSREIASTVLADFILLGHEAVGSFALSSDKTALFGTALGAWLKEIASVLNRHALPRLYELNGMDSGACARFVPGDIEKPDLERIATALTNLTGAGFLTPGGEEDENHVRELLGFPDAPTGAERELLVGMTEEESPNDDTEEEEDGTENGE